jgi:hypothetical protein
MHGESPGGATLAALNVKNADNTDGEMIGSVLDYKSCSAFGQRDKGKD